MYNMGYVTRILLNYNNFTEKYLLTVNEWCKEKESGVDAREGALKDSLLSAVLFQSVTITPPDDLLAKRTTKSSCLTARDIPSVM